MINYQNVLNENISKNLKQLKQNKDFSTFITILAITFLYGIIQIMSPGHGKTIFSGWIINSKKKFSKIVYTSILGSFAHTFSATLLVLVGWLFLKTIINTETDLQYYLKIFTGITLTSIGLYLLFHFISEKRKNSPHKNDKIIKSGFIILSWD